jgi:hypothetical protein
MAGEAAKKKEGETTKRRGGWGESEGKTTQRKKGR